MDRLRLGLALALVLIPSFVPLDYLRMHDHFGWALSVRIVGCALLAVLAGLSALERMTSWAAWLAVAGIAVIAATVLGVARFAEGAADPVYLVQAMAIVFLIIGAPLLLPLDGRVMLVVGSIPLGMQILLSLDYDWRINLPIVMSTVTAIAIATVGARAGFVARLHAYEGRRVLRRSEQKYRSLFEASRDGLILSSTDGRVTDANAAALALFGYDDREEFLALRTEALFYSGGELERARLGRMFAASGFSLHDVDVDVMHKNGNRVSVMVSTSPIHDDGGAMTGFRTIIRDVTERKALEARLRQTQKLEAVGMLAAGVAHEINNPLTYVIAHLETLQNELREPASGEVAASIPTRLKEACEGAHRVRQIVRDLKTFARLDEEERVPVDLVAVVESATKLASPEMRYRARVRTDLRLVPPVFANEGRLAQVFVNLLINAAQAIGEDGYERNEIRIETSATENEVRVEIADTGKGIEPAHLERLFDPFFTTKPVTEGSGLGLAICLKIVTSYGGRIDVESRVGVGSRFVVRLPAARSPRAAVVHVDKHTIGSPHRGRVLVVDDEPFVLSTIKMILDREHEVVGASSGSDAALLLDKDASFDVILCDLMMLRGSGMELHAEVVRRQPDLAKRMVFMSGGAYTPQAKRFLAAISNPCLDKPFGPAELMTVVDQVLCRGSTRPPGSSERSAA